jgi:hypothetical protein
MSLLQEELHQVRADEPGAAGDQDTGHNAFPPKGMFARTL